jgi:hypothetical protein
MLLTANKTSPCMKLNFSKPESTKKAGDPAYGGEEDVRILAVRGW